MYFIPGGAGGMGHWFSRLDLEDDHLESILLNSENVGSSKRPLTPLDHEVAQLTKIRSEPHDNLSRVLPGKRESTVSVMKMLAGREANYSGRGRFSRGDRCHVLSKYLPVTCPSVVDQMTTRAYVSQFSADGSIFLAAFQGSNIKIYDVERGWRLKKNILAKGFRWAITDTSLSPDQAHLVYSTMSPIVHIVNIASGARESLANITELHDGLDFSDDVNGGYSFGIFSVKFSTDGREVVAGSSDDAIYVYDLQANRTTLRISAHASDVNTVCFADESSHLIFSGSDDNLCKVWDRRCFRVRGKPAGVLIGHLEGITCIDTRGDGRYLISNGKDQAIKLWDIRKMSSNAPSDGIGTFPNYDWDYRWMDYPHQARGQRHPGDQSVSTYRGHSVLRTLIRCYFSPESSTGQKYIYTGSYDSCVYIYDLVTGAIVGKLQHHQSTIRDCSWHPNYPTLVSSSWDGNVVKWENSGELERDPSSSEKQIGNG